MRKKIFLLLNFILLLVVLVICIGIDAKKKPGVPVADAKKIEKIKGKYTLTEMDFSLCFDGEKLPYDASSHTFFLPLDMEDEEWEQGIISGLYFLDDKEKKADVLFYDDYTKSNKKDAIASGQGYPFLALNKDGYQEYNLVFSGLPMITFAGTEYQAVDGSQMFQLAIYNTDHKSDWVTECYTQARLRGNTSLTYEKKSLRLYLKELEEDGSFQKTNKNLLGLRDDDDWILNALYADNTRVRDQLCIDLWNELGANNQSFGKNYGTDSEMVEVFINDGYQGIYDLMVPIDAKQLGIDKTSEQLSRNEDVIERIYKKKYSREWMASDFTDDLPDANAINYRGGFYLQGDTVLQNTEEWNALYKIASDMEASDEEFANHILSYNDQQNLIDNWLFYQAIAGFDNENKNYYYVVRNRDGREYGYFVPWDMNISFGMVYADNVYFSEELPEIVTEPVTWQPAQRMIELDVDGSKQLLQSTWKQWRMHEFSDKEIAERIQNLEHKIKDSGAFLREDARYPNGNQKEDFSYMYDFAKERMAYVDGYVEELCR